MPNAVTKVADERLDALSRRATAAPTNGWKLPPESPTNGCYVMTGPAWPGAEIIQRRHLATGEGPFLQLRANPSAFFLVICANSEELFVADLLRSDCGCNALDEALTRFEDPEYSIAPRDCQYLC